MGIGESIIETSAIECLASTAVAYAYALTLKPGIEHSHTIVRQLPDTLGAGMGRESLRREAQTYLSLISSSLQTKLEHVQEDPNTELQRDVLVLMSEIEVKGLDQRSIDLLRCHPHYTVHRELVEKFISSMQWGTPTEQEVESSGKAISKQSNYIPDTVVSLKYDQHNSAAPVRIIFRDKPYRRRG